MSLVLSHSMSLRPRRSCRNPPGYEISPGTLYPLLQRLVRHGWLDVTVQRGGRRSRKDYRLTPKRKTVLKLIQAQIQELYDEVVVEKEKRKSE